MPLLHANACRRGSVRDRHRRSHRDPASRRALRSRPYRAACRRAGRPPAPGGGRLAARWPGMDVGQPGDAVFLRGFHGDERADGRSYRWTRGVAQVVAPGLGSADQLRLSLVAEAGRTPPQSVPVEVLIDGRPVGQVVASAAEHTLEAARDPAAGDAAIVELRTPTFRPAGDARDLGSSSIAHARADRVGLVVARLGKPVDAIGRAGLARRPWRSGRCAAGPRRRLVGVVGAVVALGAVVARPWLLAGWSLAISGAGWRGGRRPPSGARRRRGRGRPGARSARAALAALGVLIVVYGAVMTSLAARIEWIGHADYADNAVVARNLVAGRGTPSTMSRSSTATIRPRSATRPTSGRFYNRRSSPAPSSSSASTRWPPAAEHRDHVRAAGGDSLGWPPALWLGGRAGGGRPAGARRLLLRGTLFPLNDLAFALFALLLVGLAARLSSRGGGR